MCLEWPFTGTVWLTDMSLVGCAAGVVLGWSFWLHILMPKGTLHDTHHPMLVLGWGVCNAGQ